MAHPAAPQNLTARLKLSAADLSIDTSITVPAAPSPPEAVLPALQRLINTVVDAAEARERREGREISCRKGCGACCRQLVPVSRTEARAMRALVDAQPEPRRSALKQRFAEAAAKLQAADLAQTLLDPAERQGTSDRELSLSYFAQAIPCPFLEEESCSIHPDRPLVCREYLVTSPAAACSHPSQEGVDPVGVPKFSVGGRALEWDTPTAEAVHDWIPLALVLEDARASQPRPLPGPEWVKRFFAAFRVLGGRDA